MKRRVGEACHDDDLGSQRGGRYMLRRAGTALAVVVLIAGGNAFAQELIPINFQSKWFPQAQFAGYFVAQDKGFYAEEGLDVTILDGGNVNPTVQVASGNADFGTDWEIGRAHV